jgi:hypothetical protein
MRTFCGKNLLHTVDASWNGIQLERHDDSDSCLLASDYFFQIHCTGMYPSSRTIAWPASLRQNLMKPSAVWPTLALL